MASSKASSTSAVPTRGQTYDVFLSFRGEDTRNNFTDHLYAALNQRGIRVYKDDIDLHKGEAIALQLLKAIEESKFAVVVFSKNYGNSCWCLAELAKIMECQHQKGQKVLPVFYHVEPTDVRGQKRDFATAFEQHEHKFEGDLEKVKRWRDALATTANLSGWHISANSGGESADIEKIVQEILRDIQPRGKEKNLIGIEARINALNSLLKKEATEEVRMVGICGMGGLGKTTVAKALFRRISNEFEGSSFVNDVRETSSSVIGICALQRQILIDLTHHEFKFKDREDGANMIEERLCNKKILLVLDDVDNSKHLEFLAGRHEWFGPGSRIIITTRDKHLLSDTDAIYEPALLRMDHAVELFSRHAFKKNSPPEGYRELSHRAVRYADCLPLALKVLGSYFHGRKAVVWEDALKKLAETPNPEIFDTLKLSFDGLEDYEKNIFLDIACLFKGGKVEDVTIRLDCCGLHPKIGIDVLSKKSLITISEKRIEMHDLLQEMALQIVCKSFPSSRLWKHEEIHYFIEKNRDLEVIEAMVMYYANLGFNADVFESMNNLRLLDIRGKFTSSEPTVLPDKLRWLCWDHYPFSALPASHMPKLVGLKMEHGDIKHLWNGQKVMRNLKFIHLYHLKFLTRFPVTWAPNVERLILSYCWNLEEVDESLGSLKRLLYLDMRNCHKLKRLPSKIGMESLETLILKGCCSLKKFPEVSPCMVKLSHIDLAGCYEIEELPSSFRYLSSLSVLDLRRCKKLKKLPINILALTDMCSLRKLNLSWINIREEDFPKNLEAFMALEVLNLSFSDKLIQLPTGISHLSRLKHLDLSDCKNLQNAHGLPSGIQVLKASNCSSLEKIDDLSKEHEWLYKISLVNCHKLLEGEANETYLDNMLQGCILKKCAARNRSLSIKVPGSKVPSWFKQQQHGTQIALKLPPKWKTRIMGLAICGVFRNTCWLQSVSFRFEDGGMLVPELDDVDSINAYGATGNQNVWVSYIPFTLFQQQIDNDDYDYGKIVINLPMDPLEDGVRCGGHVVYKEDVESIQHIVPSFSSYWNWKVSHELSNTILFRDNM